MTVIKDFFQKLSQTFPSLKTPWWPLLPNSLTPLLSASILLLLGSPLKRIMQDTAARARHKCIAESQEIILKRQKQTNKLLELVSIRKDCLEILHLWQYPKLEEPSLILKITILRREDIGPADLQKSATIFFFSLYDH